MTDITNPEGIHSIDSLIIDISTLRVATANFDENNKLDEGGFGVVYKVLVVYIIKSFFYIFSVLVTQYHHLYRESSPAIKK
jgi:hypothetical protein